MCFSNLPIEFDEDGDPHLADDADEVEHVADPGEADVPLDEEPPEEVFEAIVASVPDSVREEIEGGTDGDPGSSMQGDSTVEGHADGKAGGD